MADPVKEFEVTPKEPAAPAVPAELAGKTPAEIWALVEAEKAKTTAALAAKTKAEQIAQEVAMAALDQRRMPAPPAAPVKDEVPDREVDPEAWIAYQVKKQVAETIKPIADVYSRDRGVVLSSAAEMARLKVKTMFPDYAEYEQELNSFLQNYGPEIHANPAAIEEAFYRVKGKSIAIKEAEKRAKEQAQVASGTRQGVADDAPKPPQFTDDQKRVASQFGTDLSQWGILEGAGTVTVDEYLAAKTKLAAEQRAAQGAK